MRMPRRDPSASVGGVAAGRATFQASWASLRGWPRTLHGATLPGLLATLWLSIPVAAYSAVPRGGDPAARLSIQPVLMPLPERDVPHLIGLNCPTDHENGVMETLWESRAGQRQSIRVTYRAGRMQILEILQAPANGTFRSSFVMDLSLARDAEYHESVLSMAPAADGMRREACLGDAAGRARYQARMDANRAMLRQPR